MEIGINLVAISYFYSRGLDRTHIPQPKREYCHDLAFSGRFHLEIEDESYGESNNASVDEVGENRVYDPSASLMQAALALAL